MCQALTNVNSDGDGRYGPGQTERDTVVRPEDCDTFTSEECLVDTHVLGEKVEELQGLSLLELIKDGVSGGIQVFQRNGTKRQE